MCLAVALCLSGIQAQNVVNAVGIPDETVYEVSREEEPFLEEDDSDGGGSFSALSSGERHDEKHIVLASKITKRAIVLLNTKVYYYNFDIRFKRYFERDCNFIMNGLLKIGIPSRLILSWKPGGEKVADAYYTINIFNDAYPVEIFYTDDVSDGLPQKYAGYRLYLVEYWKTFYWRN